MQYREIKLLPAVYALTIECRDKTSLYLGVHFTLEQAYAEARDVFYSRHEDLRKDPTRLVLWSYISCTSVVKDFTTQPVDPKTNSPTKYDATATDKNAVMQMLIDKEDVLGADMLNDLSIINANELQFIKDKIKKNGK